MKEDTNEGLHQSILEEMDLAVAGFEGKYRGIALQEFYREEVMLFAAGGLLESCFGRDMPRWLWSWAKGESVGAGRCPFVLGTPRDIAGRIAQEVLEEAVIRPEIAVRVENLEILLDLCVRGVGCCFCPTVLARTALSEEKFRSLYKFPLGEKGTVQHPLRLPGQGRVWGGCWRRSWTSPPERWAGGKRPLSTNKSRAAYIAARDIFEWEGAAVSPTGRCLRT